MQNRKEYPMARGLLDYFPDALMEVANVSHVGNQQHNPGEEMHWAKDKSTDHADCLLRHLKDRGTLDTDKLRHSAKVAWRALAMLQIEIEDEQLHIPLKNDTTDEAGKPYSHEKTPPGFKPCTREKGHAGPCALDIQDDRIPTANGIGGGNYEAHDFTDHHSEPAKMKIVYISGPMRGMPNLNFPAFDQAKSRLLQMGFWVVSPADMDRKDQTTLPTAEYAKRDIAALFQCSHVAMLPGWEKSVGALAEFALARWLGLVILDAQNGEILRAAWGGNMAVAVNTYLDSL